MLQIKNLESICLEIPQEEARMVNGGTATYLFSPLAAPTGAKIGGIVGGALGVYTGSLISRAGLGLGTDGQRTATFTAGSLGTWGGSVLGGASLAD